MARPAPSPITISAIKAIPEAAEGERTWVNGIITATVLDIKAFPNKEASIVQLKDSSGEIQANFWGRLASNMESYRGTTIKITGQGISRGSRTWQGRTSVSLNIPDKAAIQITEDSAPSQSTATQGRAVSVQSGGSFEDSPFPPSTSTVHERIVSWFQCFDEVDRVAPKDFPLEMRKDVATTVWLSYKAKYSVHADPVFERLTPPSRNQDAKTQPTRDAGGGDIDGDDIPFVSAWRKLGSAVF